MAKKYRVLVRAGAGGLGSTSAKSLADARKLAISIAAQLPIAPEGVRAAAAEVGEERPPHAYEIKAVFMPSDDGILEYENEAFVLWGERPVKTHPRPKKLAIVLAPQLIEAAAKMVGKKKRAKRRTSRR